MAKRPLLSATAFVARDRERLFDGRQIEPGVHLRWSFYRDLGFPQDGFLIERSTKQDDWETLHHIGLPATVNQALGRILTDALAPSGLKEDYQQGAGELVKIVQYLADSSSDLPMHLRDLPGESTDTDVVMKALDATLAAGFDPYIARMLGVYWIDRDVDLQAEHFYRITGQWDDTEWPKNVIEFSRLSPTSESSKPQKQDTVEILPMARVISVPSFDENDIEGPHLIVTGDAEPALRISFDQPVQKIAIDYEIYDGPSFVAAPSWNLLLDGNPVVVTADNDSMQISSSEPFQHLDIVSGSGDYWKFFRLAYWEKKGSIGNISSEPIFVRFGSFPVATPRVTDSDTEMEPPRLNNNGNVPTSGSNVHLAAHVESNPEDAHIPVRLSFGRSPVGKGAKPKKIPPRRGYVSLSGKQEEPTTVLTRHGDVLVPALYQPHYSQPLLPELVGYWSLDGTSADAKTGREIRIRGETRYVTDHPQYPAKSSLRLFGSGCLDLHKQPGMQTLGSHFTIQMWIRPAETSRSVALLEPDAFRFVCIPRE